ncbi:hypothetical protein ICC18_27820 [Paenibacillus sp. WST5]|uniref:Uncharacterized protein n=1 Tax=Paenibacillus sedimenti TaxID=2770274 RepID=A0A926KX75_9BACL|nr:hypothetical protein [Paenibacillus sedimenti]
MKFPILAWIAKSFAAGDFPDNLDIDVSNAMKITFNYTSGYQATGFGIFEPQFSK